MKKIKNFDYKKTFFIIGCLCISLLHFAVFFVYVNGATVISTFLPKEGYDTFYHYREMWNNVILGQDSSGRYTGAFGHTMIAMIINVMIFPLALITAYAFYKRVYGEKFFRVIFYLPSIIALTTLTMSFRELFTTLSPTTLGGTEQVGPLAWLLKALGVEGGTDLTVVEGVDSFANRTIWLWIIFFGVFTGLGTNVVLMCGAMMRIPVDVTEALRLDGCGFFKEMFKVSVPLIMPTITTWLLLIVTSVFGFSIMPMLVAGKTLYTSQVGIINTIPLTILSTIERAKGDEMMIKNMQALGVEFSLIMMPIVLLVRWICEKLTPDISY